MFDINPYVKVSQTKNRILTRNWFFGYCFYKRIGRFLIDCDMQLHKLKLKILTWVLILASSFGSAAAQLPALGESVSAEMPVAAERRLGDVIMRDIYKDLAYFEDPWLQAYVQFLWQPLLEAAQSRGEITDEITRIFAWKIFLMNNSSVNAFALPGGYVGVHLGLIALTHRSDELVAVLAHELSHVTQRHIARNMVRGKFQSTAGIAAMVLGLLVASRTGSGDLAHAAIAGSQATIMQGQLNFSREMEREADRMGLALMQAAGYEPRAMASMFEKLDRANRFNDGLAYPYLRSHPLTVERIAEARNYVENASSDSASPMVDVRQMEAQSAQVLHTLMSARARWWMETRESAKRRWLADSSESEASVYERISSLYLSALACLHFQQPNQAQEHLNHIRRLIPSDAESLMALSPHTSLWIGWVLSSLQVDIFHALKQTVKAYELWQRMGGDPKSEAAKRVLMLLRAQSALQSYQSNSKALGFKEISTEFEFMMQNLKSSADDLQMWLISHPTDIGAWGLLSGLARALQRPLLSIRAEAEALAVQFDYGAAIDRLRAAQRLAFSVDQSDTSINSEEMESMVIDTRLRAFEEAQRQLKSLL
jgi:predicted Zn-dependent protease